MKSFTLGIPAVKDFNFFESYHKSSENRKKQVVALFALVGFAIFAVFAVFSVYYVFDLRMEALRYEIDTNRLFLTSADTKAQLERHAGLNGKLTDLRTYNQKVDRLTDQVVSNDFINSTLLKDMTENMPQDTSVERLSLAGNIIDMEGVGGSEISIAEFEHNLAGLGYVDSVFVSEITEETKDLAYSFKMSIKMKDVPTDAE